jgi:hypothetical protein
LEIDDITKRWFAIEAELGVFADRSLGIPWWDAVRYRVNEFVVASLAGQPEQPAARRPLARRALGLVRRAALRAGLAARSRLRDHDVLVLRAPRQLQDGVPFDRAVDDLRGICPGRQLVIDTFPYYYHLPRRGAVPRRVDVGSALDRLLNALGTEFGCTWNESELRGLIARLLSDFLMDKSAYEALIARVRPKLILITQNGLEKALFAAAREADVPVFEAQHGLIGFSHLAYSYPRDAEYGDRSTFPAVFSAFSNYWLNTCHYPASRCVALGNDRFAISATAVDHPGRIMFISGDIYHTILADWAKGLARAAPDRRLIYKLHPNQQTAFAEIRREFADFTNVEVVDGSVSARTLLHDVTHVVLVQSTVALEALQMGRCLCILPVLHYRMHEDLFGLPAVAVTPDMESLLGAVRRLPPAVAPPSFFDPLDASAARRLFDEIQGRP